MGDVGTLLLYKPPRRKERKVFLLLFLIGETDQERQTIEWNGGSW